MGRTKLLGEKDQKAISRAHKMAQKFAAGQTPRALKEFLEKTELAGDLYDRYLGGLSRDEKMGETLSLEQHTLLLIQDYQLSFGQTLALAYAIGFMDCSRGTKISDLDVQGSLVESPEKAEPSQLELPGVLD